MPGPHQQRRRQPAGCHPRAHLDSYPAPPPRPARRGHHHWRRRRPRPRRPGAWPLRRALLAGRRRQPPRAVGRRRRPPRAVGRRRGPAPRRPRRTGHHAHEAGHGLAAARNLKDTSRQGRYHNAKHKALAEELGIQVAHHPIMGYSTTTLPDRTAELYGAELAALERRSPCTVAWSGSSTRTTTAALRTSRSRRHPTILISPPSAARPSTSAAARSLAGSG